MKRKSSERLAYEQRKANPPPLPPLVSKTVKPAHSNPDSALHEAAHAVAAIVYGLGLNVVDIKSERQPDGSLATGRANYEPLKPADVIGIGEQAVTPYLVMTMAGEAAERLLEPGLHHPSGDIADRQEIRQIATLAICTPANPGFVTAEEEIQILPRRKALECAAQSATDEFVIKHSREIEAVAEVLKQKIALTRGDVAEIVERFSLP